MAHTFQVGDNVVTTGYGYGLSPHHGTAIGVVVKTTPKRVHVKFPQDAKIAVVSYPERMLRKHSVDPEAPRQKPWWAQ